MKKLIAFFEIPAADFRRAIDFYETVLNMKLPTCECEEEKMAFFTEEDEFVGAVSYASDFLPSEKGVLIHFNVDEIEPTLETIIVIKVASTIVTMGKAVGLIGEWMGKLLFCS